MGMDCFGALLHKRLMSGQNVQVSKVSLKSCKFRCFKPSLYVAYSVDQVKIMLLMRSNKLKSRYVLV